MPHPESPAGRHNDWHGSFQTIQYLERAEAVYEAVTGTKHYLWSVLYDTTGLELKDILAGLLPGLLMIMAILATTTALGAAAGAAVGFLAFGAGAAPGAVIGAGAGLDVGLAILEFLGIAFLIGYIGGSLAVGMQTAKSAIKLAWSSVDRPGGKQEAIRAASQTLAKAAAQVWMGVLQGIVAYLLAEGMAAAASRVPKLAAQLRSSKLGNTFSEWIEQNWSSLLKNPRINPAVKALPGEMEMIQMLEHSGSVERGQLVRGLKGKFVIRAEGAADRGPGDFFNGPFSSAAEAQKAAQSLASSESALRQGNALPRVWPGGRQTGGARAEVVRVYKIDYEAPGFQTVAASQPESGSVMVRPQHIEAIRQGKPWVGHEYQGGANQLELPVRKMRETYDVHIVKRVDGAEYPVTKDPSL